MSSNWKWFAVKSLYRITVSGKPKNKDKYYKDSKDMIEERITIFKARSDDEAMEKAIKEGSEYASTIHFKNVYGQKVSASLIKGLDIFEMFDEPKSGKEIFSESVLVKKTLSDEQIMKQRLPEAIDTKEQERRTIFIDQEVMNRVSEMIING